MKTYSLTIEEMAVVLLEFEQTAAAKSLIESLGELGEAQHLPITLNVATRSLISKGIMALVEEDYVFEPLFKEVIDTHLFAKKTLRTSKVYSNAELVIIVYKSETGLHIAHSMSDFVFEFTVYEQAEQAMNDLIAFANIPEGEQIVETPQVVQQDILAILNENEAADYEQVLQQNGVPTELVSTLIEDFTNAEVAHTYVVLNEAFETSMPAVIMQAATRSWMSVETNGGIELESFTQPKLQQYFMQHFFSEEN